jgi:hypothetical protein
MIASILLIKPHEVAPSINMALTPSLGAADPFAVCSHFFFVARMPAERLALNHLAVEL